MIEESERLEALVDVESLPFDDVMAVLRSYVAALLSSGEMRLALSADVRPRFSDLLDSVARRRDPDPDACRTHRVAGWRLHDASVGDDRSLAALVVLCTYDRESAEFDVFGPDAMMESIMTSVCALGEGFGHGFVDHASRLLPKRKAQRADEG